MERRLPKVKFIASLFAIFTFFAPFKAFSQTPSIIQHIRFPIWAEVDAYPGTQAAADDIEAEEYAYPIARIKEIVPFLMEGLVYGWNFVYVPSDKTRGVEEYMEITPVRLYGVSESVEGSRNLPAFDIKYSSVWIENNRFNCWIDYTRTD